MVIKIDAWTFLVVNGGLEMRNETKGYEYRFNPTEVKALLDLLDAHREEFLKVLRRDIEDLRQQEQ